MGRAHAVLVLLHGRPVSFNFVCNAAKFLWDENFILFICLFFFRYMMTA